MSGRGQGGIVKRSVSIGGHRTSYSLEPEFHAALDELATARYLPLAALVREVDAVRPAHVNLSSALRLYAFACARAGRALGSAEWRGSASG